VELRPTDHQLWHALAALLVQQGDVAAYREPCRHSLEQFGQTTDPTTAHRISKECLILPGAVTNLALLAKMAEFAMKNLPTEAARDWFEVAKALAEYRLGNFAPAADWASRGVASAGTNWTCRLEGQSILAMAQYQLRQTSQALVSLRNGHEMADSKLPKIDEPSWIDWIIAHKLLDEATALIEGGARTNSASDSFCPFCPGTSHCLM
jgi:eukaryotic-like serine/threonine-protein kinase